LRHRLNVSDLNAIETRVAAWVAGCQPLLDVFTTYVCVDHPESTLHIYGQKCAVCGRDLKQKDPYLDFACRMYNLDYFSLARDYNSKDPVLKGPAKEKRQIAKPGVLGAVYRLSGGVLGTHPKTGEPMKTGLWGYAENMGVDMSQEKANETVKIFREVYNEIVFSWYALDKIPIAVMTEKPIRFGNEESEYSVKLKYALNRFAELKIFFDKFTFTDHGLERNIFRIHLPSGRRLHYVNAFVDDIKAPWKDRNGGDVYRTSLCYGRVNQETKKWEDDATAHGGLIFENIVQAIARDVLVESLIKFEFYMSLPVVGHVHDEGITETPDEPSYAGVKEMEETMRQPILWAPGLPLGADGFQDFYYHK
jgi:DNA polymerase bacteriophage-type